jgi:hydrogenase/urease accessory protein HupE
LPSAFYRTVGKEDFAERRTRQSPALGKELVYRVQDTRHRETLGKDGARQRAFAEGQKPALSKADSLSSVKYLALGKEGLYRVSSVDTRQSIFLFFYFVHQTFCGMLLHYVDLHVPFWYNYNSVFNS